MDKVKDFTHGGNIHKASKEINLPKRKILDFSANINPLGLSPKGKKEIKKGLDSVLNYPDPEYTELKDSLSNYFNVHRDYCLLGNGAIELIYSYVRFNRVGRALIPAPGFVEYEKALISRGWEVAFYESKDDIKLDSVDVIFICNPNNPTGVSYSESFLVNLLEKAKRTGTDIFLDEAFIEYSSYKSMSGYLKEFNNLYILKSLTKFFAIPGLRLGCLLTSNSDFKESYNNNLIPWCINSVVEDYIKSALNDYRYIEKSKKYIRRERVWLYKKLNKINKLKVFRTQGNYLLFKIETHIDLCKKLKDKGILIRSCSNYNNLDSTYFRIAVKRRKHNKKMVFELLNSGL